MSQKVVQHITIRRSSADDTGRVAELAVQLGYPASAEQFKERLDRLDRSSEHAVFVAETDDGRVVGWIHVFVRTMLISDRDAEIGGLVVEEGSRGAGAGRRLVEHAEDWAVDQGCPAVRVRSNVVRDLAHRFYPRLGYDRIKTQYVYQKTL